MADYKTLHGTNIDTVSSDPDNPVKGQVWYNSTSKTLKGRILSAAAWSSGGNLNTARQDNGAGGLYSDAVVFGGENPTPAATALTENWNGNNFSEVADLSTARMSNTGAGTVTAALAIGGSPNVVSTEEWNGSSLVTKTVDTD